MLPLEVGGSHLDETLVKLAFGTMLFEPELLQCFVTLIEKPAIKFLDTFEKAWILLHNQKRAIDTSLRQVGVCIDTKQRTGMTAVEFIGAPENYFQVPESWSLVE